MTGLKVSDDNGQTWQASNSAEAPATTVASLSGRHVATFTCRTGLVTSHEATLDRQLVGTGFEDRYLRIPTEDPSSPGTLNAVADTGAILLSRGGGIGETPEDPAAHEEFGFKAPALNDDMHAWHHSAAGLRVTIRDGSPHNERMIAWREVLNDEEIDSILAYVKCTWTIRSLACQGARHMACMGQ